MAKPTSSRSRAWTATDTAFIINYTDHCLLFDKNYRKTVSEVLFCNGGRQSSTDAIMTRGKQMVGYKIGGFGIVISHGTSQIDASLLDADLLQAMREGRPALQLGKLQMLNMEDDADSESSVLSSAVSTSAASLKRKASARNGESSSESTHEQSITHSETSFNDDSADPDYEDEDIKRATKKRDVSSTLHAQLSKQKAGPKLPSTNQAPVQRTQKKSAAASARTSTTAPSCVQKGNGIEVIDLLDDSPEPESERAFVEANLDGAAMSRIFTQTVEPSGRHDSGKHTKESSRVPASAPDVNEAQATNLSSRQAQSHDQASSITNDTTLAPRILTAPLPKDQATVSPEVKELQQIVGGLVREKMIMEFGDTEQVTSRYKWLQRTLKNHPGGLLGAISQDLASADLRAAQSVTVMHSLLGGQHPYDVKGRDPKPLSRKSLDDMWKELWLYPKQSFGFGRVFKTVPRPEDAGYVAARLEDLAQNRAIYGFNASKRFIVEIAHRLKSPHLAQSILGALLCQWLFSSPDGMCADANSRKERKRYEAELFTKGAEEVQHIERATMRSLFADEEFQRTKFELRAEQILLSLKKALSKLWPDAPGFDKLNSPEDWAKKVVELKQKLMLDTKEYQIHYCLPGVQFDASWMTAENKDGFSQQDAELEGKKVAACLFPALSQHDAPPLPEKPTLDILSSLMIANKTFFPSFEEKLAFDPQKVVSKAVVLVL